MRIYLFNDTSAEHAGCQAVMESLGRSLAGHEIIATNKVGERFFDEQAMRDCEVVFVNGEGTLHHNNGAFLLEMLALGQSLGKRTLLVNALFQQTPPFFPEVLARLDHFSVRDPFSVRSARECGGDPLLLLDACAGASLEGGRPQSGIQGAVKGDTHPHSEAHGLLDGLDFVYFGLQGTFADFVATLRNCSVYVTGQHHAIYGCALAGAPFVPLPGNSHKIEGFIEWSGLPISVCRTAAEVQKGVQFALDHPEVFRRLRDFVLSHRCFNSTDLDAALSA